MANTEASIFREKSVYLTLLVAIVIALALFLATYMVGHQREVDKPVPKKIRIVSLICAHDNDSNSYNHLELRVRLINRSILSKTIVWRNSMGSSQKAHTWHINETLDMDDEIIVELKDIEIQSGINNQLLGRHIIKSSLLNDCPRPIPLTGEGAKYILVWEPID